MALVKVDYDGVILRVFDEEGWVRVVADGRLDLTLSHAEALLFAEELTAVTEP